MLLLVVIVAGFLHEPVTVTDKNLGSAGKEVFDQYCAACHGPEGYGTKNAKSLRNKGFTEDYIRKMIQTGNTVMPRFTNISDSALANVAGYVLDMQE